MTNLVLRDGKKTPLKKFTPNFTNILLYQKEELQTIKANININVIIFWLHLVIYLIQVL